MTEVPWAPAKRLFEACYVVEKVVLCQLDVRDIVHVDNARAASSGKRHGVRSVLLHYAHRAPHSHGKVAVAYRLDHEVQRVHLVSLYGVLREVGHKDKRRGGVLLAQQLGGLHAVDARQVYVHEDKVNGSSFREIKGRCQTCHQEADALLGTKALEVLGKRRSRLVVILDHEHLVRGQRASPPSFQICPASDGIGHLLSFSSLAELP